MAATCATIVNGTELDGATPLHWASYQGHAGVVAALIAAGASTAALTLSDETPLQLASAAGHHAIALLLQA